MFYTEYLKKLKTCPFCILNKKEIFASNKSSDLVLSRAPYTKDHMLVVPKAHKRFIGDLTPKEKKDVEKLLMKGIELLHKKHKNVSVLYREGVDKEVGKSISHMHFHLIPDMVLGASDSHPDTRTFLSEEDYIKEIEKLKEDLE
jgi:diadenosine tetraphosphate (Ap4A) HIT family hydrolase